MLLSLNDVSFSYRTKYQTVNAVKNVSCEFEAGRLYAVVGKSGSGKTTLLSLMAGLARPDGGAISVDGKDLLSLDPDAYRRDTVSIIYQNFNLFPLLTVLENVMYPLGLNKTPKQEALKIAMEVIKKVGLDESYCKRLPSMLSGGEQQRVAIARALATGAQTILADEPTGNLDSENTENIVGLLTSLAHGENRCVIVVTHDQNVADAADTVYRMDSGRLTEEARES